MLRRLRPWLAAPTTPWVIAALTFLACLPGIFSGLAADDLLQAAVLADPTADGSAMFDADAVALARPWWTDPRWRASFLRPLTALTHGLDHLLWPDAPWAMHLVSVAWYLALVRIAAALLRELGGPRWAMGLALWMFAMDDAHAPTVSWIAARGSILAATFGTLAVVLHVRRRRSGDHPIAAWLCFALALASSEVALAVLGCLFAHAVVLDTGARRRVATMAPYLVVALTWLVVRGLLGFGTAGTGLYVQPWSEPLQFAAVLLPRTALLVTSVLGLPLLLDPLAYLPGATQTAGVLAAFALAGLALLLRPILRADASARFFALATVLSALPLAATVPQDRHTLLFGLPAFGLVSRVLVAVAEAGPSSRSLRALGWIWLILHGVIAPLLMPVRSWTPVVLRQFTEASAEALPDDPSRTVVLLAAPSDLHVMYTPTLRAAQGQPPPARFAVLYTGAFPIEVVRLGASSLELRTRGWFATPMTQVFRDAGLPTGTRVATPDFVAEVAATDAAGHPTVVRFTFPCVLEQCGILWLGWDDDRAVPAEPPTETAPLTIGAPSPAHVR